MNRTWQNYVAELPTEEKLKLLDCILNYELSPFGGAIYFTQETPAEYDDEEPTPEGLYWSVCGANLLKAKQ